MKTIAIFSRISPSPLPPPYATRCSWSLYACPARIRRPGAVLVPDPLEAVVRVVKRPLRIRDGHRQTCVEVLDAVQRIDQRFAADRVLADAADRLDEHLRCDPVAFAEVVDRIHLVRVVLTNRVHVILDRRVVQVILWFDHRRERLRPVDLRAVVLLSRWLVETEASELRMPSRPLHRLEEARVRV